MSRFGDEPSAYGLWEGPVSSWRERLADWWHLTIYDPLSARVWRWRKARKQP